MMQAISSYKQQQQTRQLLGKTGTLLAFTADSQQLVGIVTMATGQKIVAALGDVTAPQMGMKLRGCWRQSGVCAETGLLLYAVKFCPVL